MSTNSRCGATSGFVAARAFAMSPLAAYSNAARTPCLIVRLIVASGAAPGALRTNSGSSVFGRFGETGGGDRTGDEAQPNRVEPGWRQFGGGIAGPEAVAVARDGDESRQLVVADGVIDFSTLA